MIRKAVRAVTILLAALTIPAGILATQLPASAAGLPLCETNGSEYCLNTANFDLYTAVYTGNSGRTIEEEAQGGTYANAPTYLLEFKGASGECVASNNDITGVVIKPCSGSDGVVWARVKVTTNTFEWINVYASKINDQGQLLYLGSPNIQGFQFAMEPLSTAHWYFEFSFD